MNYKCKYCSKTKSITEFPQDSRNKCGYAVTRCKQCKKGFYTRVKHADCKRCGKTCREDCMITHMKTKKCMEFGAVDDAKPWKQYKSNGAKIISCPCESCEGTLIHERTVYRHLKYGLCRKPAVHLAFRYKCKYCKKSKKISEYPINRRSSSGYATSCCKTCKEERSRRSEPVSCKRCGASCRKDSMSRHRKTQLCRDFGTLNSEKPWRQFSVKGTKKVICPCQYCIRGEGKYILERVAYFHTKFGKYYRSPAAIERERIARS